ncbi:hypothetical protein [Bosea sp. FBZP-16]|uniref:hypothetical protein n=1 Tax=Bosea sp. FBZP-16 TaxID=2065382 RepID=UPI000C301EF6|nr:hypothetical protein [Bosea sp. FBZP-16]
MAQFVGLSILPHNDLQLDATGSPVLVTEGEAIGQHIRQRLMLWSGEWFLNEAAGVPWLDHVLGRPPSEIELAEAVIKAEIMATPGVAEIIEFEARYDRASRGLHIDRCQIATVLDDLIDIEF